MVLGKLPVPGRPTISEDRRARAYGACSRCGWGLFGHFSLVYHFSLLSSALWETARYTCRLKYCLKGPVKPKTTNQPTINNQPLANVHWSICSARAPTFPRVQQLNSLSLPLSLCLSLSQSPPPPKNQNIPCLRESQIIILNIALVITFKKLIFTLSYQCKNTTGGFTGIGQQVSL